MAALALTFQAMFGASAFAQSSGIVAACEGLGTSEVVFVGRPRPAMTMKVSGEEALAKAAAKMDRLNEELIAATPNPTNLS